MTMFLNTIKCKSALWITLFLCLSFTGMVYGQGDDPCTAAAIVPEAGATCVPATLYSLAGLTSTVVANAPLPGCASYAEGTTEDGWFTFTTGAAQDIFITSTAGTITDGGMALYSGAACGALTLVECDDDDGAGNMPQIARTNQAAGTYYIRFWDFSDGTGTFNLCVSINAPTLPPANDDCANAIAIAAIPVDATCVTTSVSTVAATGAADATCTGTEDDDVWHTFTVPMGFTSILYSNTDVSGSTDRVHQLFDACAGTSLGCFDNETGAFTGLTGGTTYVLRTYTWGAGASTTFDLCLRVPPPPPANDDCANAIALGTLTTSCTNATVNTESATGAADATCTGTEDDDVWYTFTVPMGSTSVLYNNTNISGSTDRVLQLFDACAGTSLGCFDNETGTFPGLTGGTTYTLRVYTWGAAAVTNFTLCLQVPPPPPANDECVGAIAFGAIPVDGSCSTQTVNTAGATGAADATCAGTEDDDVWYTFTVPMGFTSILYSTTNISGSTDRAFQLFDACAGTSLGCFAPESGTFPALTGGTTYVLRVYTSSAAVVSNFDLCLNVPPPPPVNDACAGAILLPITTACTPTAGTTQGATDNNEVNECETGTENSVWFRFLANITTATVQVTGSPTFDAVVAVFDACGGALAGVPASTCTDVTFGGETETVTLTGLTIGTTYFIQVHDWQGDVLAASTFQICVFDAGALPLELKSFTGQVQTKTNLLSWETLTEKNVQSHIVERSIDGTRWSEVGSVASQGDSQVSVKYTFEDRAPLAKAYYRLRSVDFDGKESRSNSILLTRKSDSFGITSVYPSPTNGNVTVQFNATAEEKVTIRVMDMTGRLVLEQYNEAVKDINELPITLTGLQAGVYSVTVSNSTSISAPVRFVKQ